MCWQLRTDSTMESAAVVAVCSSASNRSTSDDSASAPSAAFVSSCQRCTPIRWKGVLLRVTEAGYTACDVCNTLAQQSFEMVQQQG